MTSEDFEQLLDVELGDEDYNFPVKMSLYDLEDADESGERLYAFVIYNKTFNHKFALNSKELLGLLNALDSVSQRLMDEISGSGGGDKL